MAYVESELFRSVSKLKLVFHPHKYLGEKFMRHFEEISSYTVHTVSDCKVCLQDPADEYIC